VGFTNGTLLTGETATVPVIREVRRQDCSAEIVVLDCPPGTSCPVVAGIEGADFVALVTEPTTFGLNDLRLAVHMVRALRLRAGVVINRDGIGDDRVDEFCRSNGLPVIGRIPDDRAVAEGYSRGEIPLNGVTRFREALDELALRLTGEAGA
jgi:MinD superfamily P-loop ATPase